eukprot:8699325-Pyramimonas_sp.AAC.1
MLLLFAYYEESRITLCVAQVWLPGESLQGMDKLERLFGQLEACDVEIKAGGGLAEGARARSKAIINELYVESARVKVGADADEWPR